VTGGNKASILHHYKNIWHSLRRVVPATNLVKFGQFWQLKKLKNLNHLEVCWILLLITLIKNPTVWLAPSSQTVGSLFRVIHEQAKRNS
jgi:hypothetical protein